jgi:assimilatory nitrate reductase catalytic subunit
MSIDHTPTRTTCPYCGVGCGVLAGDGGATIKGDPQHPANFGRLCSKGSALGDTLGLENRLLYPEVAGRRANWDEALEVVAAHFAAAAHDHGPDSVAFYVSGQLLTEDYYVANKLMKGFIGSANIDTNSRLCMSSSVAGHKRAFGFDTVPGCYEDLEQADLIVLVGSNTAWCHPVLFQRIAQHKKHHPKLRIVNIDPRATATAESADLQLALKPGSDVLLFNGLLHYLRMENRLDFHFLERHATGFADALESARQSAPSIPAVAAGCGLAEADVASFYRWFAETEKTVTAWSQGVNQSSSGSDKVNAIINVHLATGRIGKPGMGPFSLTGQPNAMGGREVGGLANQVAAHLDWNEHDLNLLADFWQAPNLARRPGLKAVELFQALEEGRIKALWVMATNPAVSLPDSNAVRRALEKCPFLVVSDCCDATDLAPYAHVRLPALAWGEKNGTVTNSERRISRQRPFLPAPGEAKPDWWIVSQVAQHMGFHDAFAYQSPAEIFDEHARLSGYHNHGARPFDISGLAGLSRERYDGLQPIQWPVTAKAPNGTARLWSAEDFAAHGRRAKLLAVTPKEPAEPLSADFPLTLNTGRVRDHWHTMTRTAMSPRLCRHLGEPYAELHPSDAERYAVTDGALLRLSSRYGIALARAKVTTGQRPGSVFMPMHWNDQHARLALANALVNPVVDPLSGEPESKSTPVAIQPFPAAWHGFVLSRQPLAVAEQDAQYAVRIRGSDCWLYELAGLEPAADWPAWVRDLAATAEDVEASRTETTPMVRNAHPTLDAAAEWLEFHDPRAGRYRTACLSQDKLLLCAFIGPDFRLPSRDWLESLFAKDCLSGDDRTNLLAGRPRRAEEDGGPTVCACFRVGRDTLKRAIIGEGLSSVEAIGSRLQAGTGCGSCLPELRTLLQEAAAERG